MTEQPDGGTAPSVTGVGDLDAFRQHLADHGIDVENLRTETSGTLQTPAADEPLDLTTLPILGAGDGDLALGAMIGDGGMGVVHVAQQRALRRDVAVKIVRAQDAAERHAAMIDLVREARVAGGLEHPNIVPVHALARTTDGQVMLVMKRIEGRSWSSLLGERKQITDELHTHLDVLMDVCRAVHFAGARDVVHCDLKPQNVMVGAFGEVYLLDWGIAVPAGTVTRSIAGTPSFIAPEMVTIDAVIDARTDVYLLGGLLHVILTGRPPHAARSIAESLHAAACATPPRFGDDVPEELAQMCARALSASKDNRFETADELRLAIVGYLEHAGARSLCVGALEQLAILDRLVAALPSSSGPTGVDGAATDAATDAATGTETNTATGTDTDARAFRAYTAARFAFEQALREWPRFGTARTGLQRAHLAFARHELRRRRPDRARTVITESGVHDAALEAELAALEVGLADEARAQLDRDALARAFALTGRKRSYVAPYIGAVVPWVITTFVIGHLTRAGTLTVDASAMAVMMGLLTVVVAAFTAVLYARSPSALIPRISMITTSCMVGIVVTWTAAAVTNAPFVLAFVVAQLFMLVVVTNTSIFVAPRVGLAAIPVVASVPLMLGWPAWAFECNGLALGITMAMVALWWPRDDRLPARPPSRHPGTS